MDNAKLAKQISKLKRDSKTGRIIGPEYYLIPIDEIPGEITGWKFRKRRQGSWAHRYFDTFRGFLRKYLEHIEKGIYVEASFQIQKEEFGWFYIRGDPIEWILEKDVTYGKPREYWQEIIDQVKKEIDFDPSRPILRWRTKVYRNWDLVPTNEDTGWKWGWIRHYDDAYSAFRVFLKHRELLKPLEGSIAELAVQNVDGGIWHIIDEEFKMLLEPDEIFGHSKDYWKERVKAAIDSLMPKHVDRKPLNFDPYVKGPSASDNMIFSLEDIPDDWEIELNENFIIALDKLNRPWKYETRKRGANIYWDSKHPLYKRLWGWHRFHHRGHDNGAWMKKHQIALLREYVIISDKEFEKAIIGIKKGPSANPLHSRVPIHANRWWAQLFGFYYSSGSRNKRMRKGRYVEDLIRIRAHEDVVPMVFQAARAVGAEPKLSNYVPIFDNPQANGLGTTVRPTILLTSAILKVMEKFGLSTAWEEDEQLKGGQGRTSSANIEPFIPDWIKEDDDRMHGFVEGFLNGSKGQSIMGPTSGERERRYGRPWLMMGILIRMSGRPQKWIKRFIKDIQQWIEEYGVKGYFRELEYYGKRIEVNTFKYEYSVHNREGWKWFLDNFEIRRPDLRARLFARIEAVDNPELYECLIHLRSPDNVIFGVLFEQPMTKMELSGCLQMREIGVTKSLKALQKRGMVARRGDHYYYDPEEFIKRVVRDNRSFAETIANRMMRYSVKLLYQCSECHRVYMNSRDECGLCGGVVVPVERKGVLKRLNGRRRYALMLAHRITTNETEGLKW